MSLWGQNMKGEEKKGENVKEKRRKGKENEKTGSKRVKLLQNREELWQKGHDGSRKNITFRGGGG
jgi:hypothetical protein